MPPPSNKNHCLTSKTQLIIFGSAFSFAANFQYGFSSTYPNTAVRSIKDYLNHSLQDRHGIAMDESMYDWMWNLLLNIWFVGFFVGIWFSPLLNDRFGRKGRVYSQKDIAS